jgi:hypothetical protein
MGGSDWDYRGRSRGDRAARDACAGRQQCDSVALRIPMSFVASCIEGSAGAAACPCDDRQEGGDEEHGLHVDGFDLDGRVERRGSRKKSEAEWVVKEKRDCGW